MAASKPAGQNNAVDVMIRKYLNMCGVFVRSANNHRIYGGAAVSNARQAYEHAVELIRTLPDEERSAWDLVAIALLESIQAAEIAFPPDPASAPAP